MNLRLRTLTPFLLMLSFQVLVSAAELADPDVSTDGKIDVIYGPNLLEPYRERRTDWAFSFGLNLENILPDKALFFSSTADEVVTYEDLFGKTPIKLVQISMGAKYNFSLGALSVEAIGGMGEVSDGRSGASRTLTITKTGLGFGWTLDAIFQEPYVAPYVMGQVFQIDYVDKGSFFGEESGRTAASMGYTIGLLVQLNSLDPSDAAFKANADYGLNNTYLDIFLTQYNTSSAEDDPDLKTAMNWGAGLRLEF